MHSTTTPQLSNENNNMPPKNQKPPSQITTGNYEPPQPSYIFEYLLDPIYTKISEFYPKALTPNQLTVFGITCTCMASLLYCALVLFPNVNDASVGGSGLPLGSSGFERFHDIRFSTFEQFGQFNSKFDPAQAKNFSSPALPDFCFHHSAASFSSSSSSPSNQNNLLPKGSFVIVDQGGGGGGDGGLSTHRLLLILIGIMNIIYMICDNTDGKQARRWGMCSTVGEYLDHGMDAVAFNLSVFVLSTLLFERITLAIFVQCFLSILTYMTHSVNYSSGIMIWGNRYVSVDEGTLLFSVGPLVVGCFPSLADKVLPFCGLRVVQFVYFFLVTSQLDTAAKLIKCDRKVFNFGLLCHVGATVAMVLLGVWHAGGSSREMTATLGGVHSRLSPLADWDLSNSSAATSFFAAVVKCGAIFIRNIFTCYVGMFGIMIALIASIMSHIAVAAKTLFYDKESWTPIAIVAVGVLLFAVHPPLAVLVTTAGHAVQIRFNIVALISPEHVQKVNDMKSKK